MNFLDVFLPFLVTISFTLIQSSGFELDTDGDRSSVTGNDRALRGIQEVRTVQGPPCLGLKSCASHSSSEDAGSSLDGTSFFQALRHKRELRMKTTILSPRVTTVQRGSILNLLCVVSEHEKPPKKIVWVINGTTLDFQYHRGGVHLEVIKQKRSTTSKLTINDFHQEDAGAYECRAEGYTNHVMEPSYRDAVDVKVVEHVKKELFSDSGASTNFQRPLPHYYPALLIAALLLRSGLL